MPGMCVLKNVEGRKRRKGDRQWLTCCLCFASCIGVYIQPQDTRSTEGNSAGEPIIDETVRVLGEIPKGWKKGEGERDKVSVY